MVFYIVEASESGDDLVCIEVTSGSSDDGRTSRVFIDVAELNGILSGRLRLAVVQNDDVV